MTRSFPFPLTTMRKILVDIPGRELGEFRPSHSPSARAQFQQEGIAVV
jgi:hypothetical protein